MISTKSLLLACTALAAVTPAFAAAPDAPFAAAQARPRDTAQMIAQAPPPLTPAQIEEEKVTAQVSL